MSFSLKTGRKEIVQFFIEKGVDVHSTDSHGRTPLHFSAYEGSVRNLFFHIFIKSNLSV